MDSERWKQVKEVLQSALDRAPEERDAFLRSACAGDEALKREVRSLLASDERAGGWPASAIFREDRTGRFVEHQRDHGERGHIPPARTDGHCGRTSAKLAEHTIASSVMAQPEIALTRLPAFQALPKI